MVIGLRLLSNNLNGQTANVTFSPISGGTIDLGEQTIPFNYINPNPYGTYEFYVPLYDYTYELVVNEPTLTNQQSVSILSRLTGNTDMWALGSLNYNDFTSQVIDLELSANDWVYNAIYQSQENGYGFIFGFSGNSNIKKVIFTNYNSEVIYTYNANTNGNYSNDYLDGYGFYFNDRHNGNLFVLSNAGFSQVSYDPDNQSLSVINEYDMVTENGSVLISIDTFSSNTTSIQLVNSSGTTVIDEYDNTQYEKIYSSFKGSNCILNYNRDLLTGYYTDINIISQEDGGILESYTLSADTYSNSPTYTFVGKNKVGIIFYQWSNQNIPYTIFYFNGNNNNSDVLIKDRGENFYNIQLYGARPFDNNQIDSGSIFFIFWGDTEDVGDSSRLGYGVQYCDFVYIIDGTDTFTTYNYQDSGIFDKSITLYNWYYSNTFNGWGNTGDDYYSEIIVGSEGVIYSQQTPISGLSENTYVYRWNFGNKYLTLNWNNDSYTGGTLNLFDNTGLLDSIFFNRISPEGNWWSTFQTYGIFMISTYNKFYYMNNLSTSIDEFEGYSGYNTDVQYSNIYTTDSGHMDGKFLLVNTTNGDTKLVTSETSVDGITLPTNGGYYTIKLGKSKFMYVYNLPTWEGNIVIELYDYNFNLLNSVTTTYDDWINSVSTKDRFFVQFIKPPNYEWVLISEDSINSIFLSSVSSNWQINDAYYYD